MKKLRHVFRYEKIAKNKKSTQHHAKPKMEVGKLMEAVGAGPARKSEVDQLDVARLDAIRAEEEDEEFDIDDSDSVQAKVCQFILSKNGLLSN